MTTPISQHRPLAPSAEPEDTKGGLSSCKRAIDLAKDEVGQLPQNASNDERKRNLDKLIDSISLLLL
jgi:hypothetical protein